MGVLVTASAALGTTIILEAGFLFKTVPEFALCATFAPVFTSTSTPAFATPFTAAFITAFAVTGRLALYIRLAAVFGFFAIRLLAAKIASARFAARFAVPEFLGAKFLVTEFLATELLTGVAVIAAFTAKTATGIVAASAFAITLGFIARLAFKLGDRDVIRIIAARLALFRNSGGELVHHAARDFEQCIVAIDPDRTDFILGNMTPAAQPRQNPAGIGALVMANIHFEPDCIFKAGTRTIGGRLRLRSAVQHLFRRRHFCAVRLDQHRGNFFRRFLGHQALCEFHIIFVNLDRLQQCLDQTLGIIFPDIGAGRRIHPLRVDLCSAQHGFNPLAALVRHDDNRRSLFTGTARPSGTVL